ncbi:MAG: hypothetical protein C4527_28115 [Candidatus Omnitrophota bacterium]|jgi:hypothetical protein|nr:MAG: hypothetical protein C4527_28115 [Candidatus Omnitrophota bacterium]
MQKAVFGIGVLFGAILLGTIPVHAQGVFDKTVDWPIIGSAHVEGSVVVTGSGANTLYLVKGNGEFGVRIETDYGYGLAGDEGFFVYTDKTGSWSMQGRLYPFYGQCALMIRETGDDPTANFYSVEMENVGESASALYRTRAGASGNVRIQIFDAEGNPIQDEGDGLWFRVTRVEPVDVFFGEYSPDGQNWFIADSRVIRWPSDTAAFGIAVGSGGDNDALGEVEVSSVAFVSTPPVALRVISQQSYKGGETLDVAVKVYVSGQDRSTATVLETPPSGWTASEISNGGTIANGSIQWRLSNLPVGETVVTYKTTAPAAPADFAIWSGNVQESVNILGPTTLPFLDLTGGDRLMDGLVLYYTFNEGEGLTVHDTSGFGEPMNLTIADPTRIEWGPGYLETTGVNHIESSGPATKLINACKASDEITIEAWLKTSDIRQNGTARVITCSIDAVDRNFTLGQGHYGSTGDRFEIRLRTDIDPNNLKLVTSLWSNEGTLTEALTHVVFVRNDLWELYAYVNNELVGLNADPVVNGSFASWDDTFKFGLANEVSADRGWLGQLHLVALYNRALSAQEVSQNYNAGPFVDDDVVVSNWEVF